MKNYIPCHVRLTKSLCSFFQVALVVAAVVVGALVTGEVAVVVGALVTVGVDVVVDVEALVTVGAAVVAVEASVTGEVEGNEMDFMTV